MMKEFSEMTFEELAQWCQARILLAIPTGKFNQAVEIAIDDAMRWRAEQDKKRNTK